MKVGRCEGGLRRHPSEMIEPQKNGNSGDRNGREAIRRRVTALELNWPSEGDDRHIVLQSCCGIVREQV